eukprot:433071-Pleurochrysis_carterae.AAC.1
MPTPAVSAACPSSSRVGFKWARKLRANEAERRSEPVPQCGCSTSAPTTARSTSPLMDPQTSVTSPSKVSRSNTSAPSARGSTSHLTPSSGVRARSISADVELGRNECEMPSPAPGRPSVTKASAAAASLLNETNCTSLCSPFCATVICCTSCTALSCATEPSPPPLSPPPPNAAAAIGDTNRVMCARTPTPQRPSESDTQSSSSQ